MKLTDAERKLLFRTEEKLRNAKNMLVGFGSVVRGGFGGPHDVLKGTELHTLSLDLDHLEGEIGALALQAEQQSDKREREILKAIKEHFEPGGWRGWRGAEKLLKMIEEGLK